MLVERRIVSCSSRTFWRIHEVSPCQRCFFPHSTLSNPKLRQTVDTRVHHVSISSELDSTISAALRFGGVGNEEASPTLSSDKDSFNEFESEEDDEDEKETPGISKIRVSRQKFIPISKTELIDAIVRTLYESRGEDPSSFLLVSSLLDSIIHAEHKEILEELRSDYSLIEDEGDSPNTNGFASSKIDNYEWDLKKILGYTNGNDSVAFSDRSSKLAVAARFQSTFMQLLDNAQFQELSPMDLALASSLNSDYILTLPIYVDWKKASESNAIIFRRGYTTEKQKGLMLAEKLDYLQSRLLQRVFSLVSRPLRKFGIWVKRKLKDSSESEELSDLLKRMATWQEDSSLFQFFKVGDDATKGDSVRELPIWLAARKAVTRYEGFLSPVGPRGRLVRKLLTRVGLQPSPPQESLDDAVSISLSRVSLSDIWKPATGNGFWKTVRTSFSILLSPSYLQEPAFQELIILYNKEPNAEDKSPISPLQLKIYERIPIPDLPVVFPDKKLSFRILDTVRLDLATILGLMAFVINYKFEDILSSPSAVVLDFVATSALILFVSRVVLGYKRTWDRYQLLVNKTLYEKTLASGFGSVYFLLDASEQQQYKEALLAYAILLKRKKEDVISKESLALECERFLYSAFKIKVEMPVEKALKTLLRLGLAKENDGLWGIPCEVAHQALRQRWNSLLR